MAETAPVFAAALASGWKWAACAIYPLPNGGGVKL